MLRRRAPPVRSMCQGSLYPANFAVPEGRTVTPHDTENRFYLRFSLDNMRATFSGRSEPLLSRLDAARLRASFLLGKLESYLRTLLNGGTLDAICAVSLSNSVSRFSPFFFPELFWHCLSLGTFFSYIFVEASRARNFAAVRVLILGGNYRERNGNLSLVTRGRVMHY